ncbi:CocE/NonD family hydrolase [Methanobacterium sp.]|uniref:CocE/NonD family hydrolase n=1 Tax=Methanobacterium sp. TaxID=2164 RepID=UPI0025CE9959|nr:CocE/NonD family hydrolase [Methanobacterium sp.]MBI5458226.1 CocE/NonD family hydrolase [Methanobacterium sp.]
MKETPFAVILIVFLVFLGVLYGVVLLEDNETSITEGTNALLNQFQSPNNQSEDNMVQTNLNNTPESQNTNPSQNQSNTSQNITDPTTSLNSNQTSNTTKTVNYTVKTIIGQETSLRDGAKLVSDIWLPQEDGKYPVIMIRTPYGRSAAYMNYTGMGEYFAKEGYVFMVQDVRGKGDSQGTFNFLFQEGQDGYDSIEWAANQSWSNGKVGMMGSSYMGADQWLAAREKPPHLVCIAPTSATGRYMEEIPSIGGVFYMGWTLPWTLANNGNTTDLNTQNRNWTPIFNHRPLLTADEVTGTQVPLYRQFLEHPTMDDYWKRIQFKDQDFTSINLPTLTTCGWFDTDQPGALFYWNGLKKNSTPADQYLIIGPWLTNGTFEPEAQLSQIGDLPVSGAQSDVYATHLAFFDYYLKNSTSSMVTNSSGRNSSNISSNNSYSNVSSNNSYGNISNSTNSTSQFNLPRVTVYITGLSKWINLTSYPPEDMNITPLYLNSRGQANTLNGNGFLEWNFNSSIPANNSNNSALNSTSSVNSTTVSDNYTYDPANPRPVPSGSFAVNSNSTENRSDILVYTTAPLEEPVMIIGPVAVELYAASDAKDTDFVARVLDVYPNGTVINLGPYESGGSIRARFRQGFDKEVLLEPGKIEKYRIELYDMGHVFLPGHSIRLEVSSSAYPILHPNPNTGNPIATDTQQQVAHQTIYHDSKHPSSVLLPVIPSNSSIYKGLLGSYLVKT